jgi:HAD superfamily hydrolase (TIGR01509 family)
MQTKALLFDFDGTIADTEVPGFRAWQEVYERHGHVLTLDEWAACVGTLEGFDPWARLEELVGDRIDREAVDAGRLARERELLAGLTLRPGVESYLFRAAELRLQVAIASSSSTPWVTETLGRLGHGDGWACINCANGDIGRAKPLPCLYEESLESLGLTAAEAIAFEDSPNGIRAAKAAGLYCVAVPNAVTETLDLSEADLRLSSFEDMTLDDLLELRLSSSQ